jgi:Leucine-rich repeat (LRR) protein
MSTPMEQMRARSVMSTRTVLETGSDGSFSSKSKLHGSGARVRANKSVEDMTDGELLELATEDTLLEHHLEDFYGEPANYSNIKVIDLSGCNMEKIPTSLFVLCLCLTTLNLSKNSIVEVPETS